MGVKYVFNPFTSQLDVVNDTSFAVDDFVVTNPSTKTYSLSSSPISDSEFVTLNGVLLLKGATEDYTISGADVTLDASCELRIGDKIVVKYQPV